MTNRAKARDLVFPAVFCAIWAFLFWKTRYGIANIDESFYLTIPLRFCQGDLPMLHEWHLSQTSGLLLTPLMRLYLAVFHDTSGILLRFRWIFTAVWGMAALFFFLRLKRLSVNGAMTASLCFLIYTPFGIMALSYNTMGILLLMTACVLLATSERNIRLQYTLAGLCFAGSVLCCPYLLVFYVLFSVSAVLLLLCRKREMFSCWLWFSVGAGIACAVFCAVLLSKASLQRYLEVFPYMLEDPEHEVVSLWSKTKLYLYFTATSSPILLASVPVFCVAVWLAWKRKRRMTGFILVCTSVAAMLVSYFLRYRFLNHLMFPASLLGLYCVLCSRDSGIRKLFWCMWVPGLGYTFCLNLSSNQLFYAVSSAAVVMAVASILMGARFLEKDRNEEGITRKTALCGFVVLLLIQGALELILRYDNIYWDDDGIMAQTVAAEAGPEKGIRMNEAALAEYTEAMEDLEVFDRMGQVRSVLFLSEKTWSYLGTEKENASYSAWISGLNENTVPRLKKYYALFPEKIPDAVLVGPYYPKLATEVGKLGYVQTEQDSAYYTFLVREDLAE